MGWGSASRGAEFAESDELVHRISIRALGHDPRADGLVADAHALGIAAVRSIEVADLFFVRGPLTIDDEQRLGSELLVDPLLQSATWGASAAIQGRRVVETSRLAGVTDPTASEIVRAAGILGIPIDAAASGRRYEITGALDDTDVDHLVRRLLANPVIEQWCEGEVTPAFTDGVKTEPAVERIAIRNAPDRELETLNRDRGLALDLAELREIRDYFERIGRDPTDVEIETIAQTWSEHCAHKTFRAAITLDSGAAVRPLLAQLRDATKRIAAPFVRSAFVGNAGIVEFGGTLYALKAETHNHPSAVEPFGGANTGVGGVIRDVLGVFATPIATTDVLCFGPLDTDPASLPDGVLHPRRIRSGVIAGVADYGNKIGLPTVAGAVLHDPGYTANPLVFCGCIGTVPHDRMPAEPPHEGDRVVVIGGRTGRDGIRGATFSSMAMDATTGDVAGASVQIGDPIIEKLVMDLVREGMPYARAITDCGAGGLSSAIGEMSEGIGADLDLARVPLKYPGLQPWEIWLSEAQERMVLAVHDTSALADACDRHGVEWADVGHFTGNGRLVVRQGDAIVLDLDTGFLHDGRPRRNLRASSPSPDRTESTRPEPADCSAVLLALLAHPTIASKADVVRRYDHEIRGATVIRPLVGARDDGPADGVVVAEPDARGGIAIGIGVNPWFGALDAERMAEAVVDEAIRNAVVAGADPRQVALLDNFSWGDPQRPSTLGALVAAVQGCVDVAVRHGAPFVSGKDSLNNEYLGADGERHAVPPTLVITAVACVPDADAAVTPDLKRAGNALVFLGRTRAEFGGSHFDLVSPFDGPPGAVPAPDPGAPARYLGLHHAIRSGLVRAAHDVSDGGLAVALAEMGIGGDLGIAAELPGADATVALFAESTGRIVIEVEPEHEADLLARLGADAQRIGTVTSERAIRLTVGNRVVVDVGIDAARTAFNGETR